MKVIKSYIPVTDLVTGLKDEYAKQVKCAYFNDVKYIKEMGILTDLKIILLTIPAVLKGEGSY